jgi:hypothetical protein
VLPLTKVKYIGSSPKELVDEKDSRGQRVEDSGGVIWVILKPENSRNFKQI